MLTDKQFARLPKYVREHITYLEQKLELDVAYYQKQLHSAEEGTGSIGWGLGPYILYFLPEAAVVHFDLDGHDVTAKVEDGVITINSNIHTIAILPAYSNVVYIGVLADS